MIIIFSYHLVTCGTVAELVDWLLAEKRLVFSQTTFAELESRIWKPKFVVAIPEIHEFDRH